MRVAIVDYGTGNLGSMLRALEEVGAYPYLAAHPGQLSGADRLILPGVGSFTDCMDALVEGGWVPALRKAVNDHAIPLLGVCVGMQLLASRGDEGAEAAQGTRGLGFVPGVVKHLRVNGCTARLPHVGWNSIEPVIQIDPILAGIPGGTHFYFVHSYALQPDAQEHILATVNHDVEFVAVVRRGLVWGAQFHPEKSSRAGFRLLRNFLGHLPC